MAHERGQADVEAGRSMRSWGWLAYKKRDATRCPHCGGKVLPVGVPGTWDFPNVGIPIWHARKTVFIDVEVKAANTALPFSKLRENQRTWAAETPERPKWLWIGLGKNAVNAIDSPRKSYLVPYSYDTLLGLAIYDTFLGIEALLEKTGRKSLPYDYWALRIFELEWRGDKTWTLPEQHWARLLYGGI